MPKIIDGSVACRIGLAPEHTGKKLYCDYCKEFFDSREHPPCESSAAPLEWSNPGETLADDRKRKIEKWRKQKRSE